MRSKTKRGNNISPETDAIVVKTAHFTEMARSTIALSAVLLCVVVLLISAISAEYHDDFHILQTIWAVIAGPMGWIVGYFFHSSRKAVDVDPTATTSTLIKWSMGELVTGITRSFVVGSRYARRAVDQDANIARAWASDLRAVGGDFHRAIAKVKIDGEHETGKDGDTPGRFDRSL